MAKQKEISDYEDNFEWYDAQRETEAFSGNQALENARREAQEAGGVFPEKGYSWSTNPEHSTSPRNDEIRNLREEYVFNTGIDREFARDPNMGDGEWLARDISRLRRLKAAEEEQNQREDDAENAKQEAMRERNSNHFPTQSEGRLRSLMDRDPERYEMFMQAALGGDKSSRANEATALPVPLSVRQIRLPGAARQPRSGPDQVRRKPQSSSALPAITQRSPSSAPLVRSSTWNSAR